MKIPRKCHNHEASPSRGFKSRRNKGQLMTKQTPHMKPSKPPVSVAQSNSRPIGDQEVAGSSPAGSGYIFSWRLIMKYFLRSFSHISLLSQEGQLSVSGERMYKSTGNHLEDLAYPGKNVVRYTDMSECVDRSVKP